MSEKQKETVLQGSGRSSIPRRELKRRFGKLTMEQMAEKVFEAEAIAEEATRLQAKANKRLQEVKDREDAVLAREKAVAEAEAKKSTKKSTKKAAAKKSTKKSTKKAAAK